MDCEISAELTNANQTLPLAKLGGNKFRIASKSWFLTYPHGGRKARSEGRGADRNDHEPGRPGEIVWAGEQVWETLRHRRLFP